MATAEQTKEAARRRKANQRARDKGLPEPYPTIDAEMPETKSAREQKYREDYAYAQELDATGQFYRSECRTAMRLLAIFCGNNDLSLEETDGTESKTGKKKNIPNPSTTALRIRAVEFDGIKIDPDMKEYRKTFEVNEVVSFKRWLELRDKARKDLFWLGRLLKRNFFHATHQQMCDMFVEKNFDGLYFYDFEPDDVHEMIGKQQRFTANGEPTRTMLLFAPRSSYKSTIDGVDAVQWMLNAPDIRILIMTSVLRLSKELMGEIKGYFYLPPRGEASNFHLLFPEYVLTGVDGRSKEPITCPAQNFNSKEPHLWITSLDASFVGSRCDIRKIDDAVEDKNSWNDELRESLKEKIKATNALVEPWGFTDVIGTRYFTNDWYGWRMGQVRDGSDELTAMSTEPFAYLSLSAWEPKPEHLLKYHLLLEKKGGIFEITYDMVTLFFPYKLSFSELRTKLKEYKERGFKNQYLNIATDPNTDEDNPYRISFTEADLKAHMYQREAAPKMGDVFVVWDWALSNQKTSDYSVGVVARLYRNDANEWAWVILEIVYNKWKYSELAHQIVALSKRWGPKLTMIEKSNAADMLNDEITRVSRRFGYEPTIYWKQPSREDDAKRNRIKSLEMLLAEHRLHFVGGPWMDETIKQFTQYTGEKKNKGRKDDIPDAASYLTYLLPLEARPVIPGGPGSDPSEDRRLQEEQEKQWAKKHNYERMFGSNLLTNTQAGPVIQEPEPVKTLDPRMQIFGNKGPWRM